MGAYVDCRIVDPSLTKAVLHVNGGSSTLEDTESLDNGGGHAVLRLVDVEVTQRTVPMLCQYLLPSLSPL